jgi:dynein light chain LC8-type
MSGEQRKAVIKNADMEDKMQQDAVDTASKALSEFNIEKVRKCDCTNYIRCLVFANSPSSFAQDVAAYIKKEFDRKHGPTWHVIVGRNFGSYVTHETKHFIYFYLGQVAILLFKSG